MRRSNFLLQIELNAKWLLVDEQRFLDVSLDEQVAEAGGAPVLRQVRKLLHQHYALTAPATRGLSYKGEFRVVFHVLL